MENSMKKSADKGFYLIAKQFVLFLLISFLPACQQNAGQEENLTSEIIDIWDNGKPKIVRFFREDESGQKILVREKQYYPEGSISMQGDYLNNKRSGIWKSWFEDGTLWSEGRFVEGKREGPGTVYHPNGKKHLEGQYKNGKRVGLWRAWNETGTLISEQTHP
jgi:antitoxin component YwqK of YwqJK toxin-antitoxin module